MEYLHGVRFRYEVSRVTFGPISLQLGERLFVLKAARRTGKEYFQRL